MLYQSRGCQCEQCGAVNGERGTYNSSSIWFPEQVIAVNHPECGWREVGHRPKVVTARVSCKDGLSRCVRCAEMFALPMEDVG